MSDLRIIAIDDEPLALKRLQLLLGRIPDVTLVDTAGNVVDALECIRRHKPDVLLLDIKMAGESGFDVIDRLDAADAPLVIFVTAFDEFAISAFEVGAVDYVLKPVDLNRLSAALDKARVSLTARDANEQLQELRQVVEALRAHSRPSQSPRYETEIWAERRNQFVRISVEDLDWVAAERDYVRLHARGESYLLRNTISAVQERLDPAQFVRVRRSALVRIDRVTGIQRGGYGDFRVSIADGSEVRVGRTYVKQIRNLITPRVSAAGS